MKSKSAITRTQLERQNKTTLIRIARALGFTLESKAGIWWTRKALAALLMAGISQNHHTAEQIRATLCAIQMEKDNHLTEQEVEQIGHLHAVEHQLESELQEHADTRNPEGIVIGGVRYMVGVLVQLTPAEDQNDIGAEWTSKD